MSGLQENIKRINEKLQQLLKQHQSLQKDNERQSALIETLQEAGKKDMQHISELQERVNILKATTGKMDDAGKKEFEKDINRYIREIDKCIGFLSE